MATIPKPRNEKDKVTSDGLHEKILRTDYCGGTVRTGDNGGTRDEPSQGDHARQGKTYVTDFVPQSAMRHEIFKVGVSYFSTTTEAELFSFLLSTTVRDLKEAASQWIKSIYGRKEACACRSDSHILTSVRGSIGPTTKLLMIHHSRWIGLFSRTEIRKIIGQSRQHYHRLRK